ncbi:MAG: T9SS type A sorting domain-containing protein [Bacteroidales bacterium]|jgi:hypothetical protein|nr:T9SS type A sorting domain-containing protein [Bacteroidales bacterium]
MKKIVFLIIATLVSFLALCQQPAFTHGDGAGWFPPDSARYLLPVPFSNGIHLLPVTSYGTVGSIQNLINLSAIAQQYVTDTTIKIIGISALISNENRFFGDIEKDSLCTTPLYLQIRQGLDNVIAEARYDTFNLFNKCYPPTFTECSCIGCPEYLELYFENPIFVQDTFFAVTTILDAYAGESLDTCNAYVFAIDGINASTQGETWPMVLSDGNWMPMYQYFGYQDTVNVFNTFYLFPIIDTAWQPIPANVQTENPVVDTASKEISLPIRVVEWGEPMLTQIGLVYGKDSTTFYINSANNVPFAMTNQNYYTYHLPADSIDCDTTYYFRAYFRDDMSFSHYGETKSFVYPCDKEDSNSLTNVFNEIPIKLYPNPTDKELTIETTLPMRKVEVINSNGQTIYTTEPNKKEVKINTSKFVSGNYITVITTSKGIIKRSFVVK